MELLYPSIGSWRERLASTTRPTTDVNRPFVSLERVRCYSTDSVGIQKKKGDPFGSPLCVELNGRQILSSDEEL